MWRNPPAAKPRVVEPLPPGWLEDLGDPALAAEFGRAPGGPHSERLRRLLTVMRALPVGGKPVFVIGDDGQRWLARIPRRTGDPLEVVLGPFEGPITDDHQRAAFALRWEALFGERIES